MFSFDLSQDNKYDIHSCMMQQQNSDSFDCSLSEIYNFPYFSDLPHIEFKQSSIEGIFSKNLRGNHDFKFGFPQFNAET